MKTELIYIEKDFEVKNITELKQFDLENKLFDICLLETFVAGTLQLSLKEQKTMEQIRLSIETHIKNNLSDYVKNSDLVIKDTIKLNHLPNFCDVLLISTFPYTQLITTRNRFLIKINKAKILKLKYVLQYRQTVYPVYKLSKTKFPKNRRRKLIR